MLRTVLCMLLLAVFATSAADPLTGRWHMLSSGTEIDITQSAANAEQYKVSIYHSDDFSIPQGTEIGTIHRTATPGRYVGTFKSQVFGPVNKKRNLIISLRPDGSLGFEPYNKGRRISLWRWIPYLFRITVTERGKQPSDIEGAVRADKIDLTHHRVL